MNSERIITLTQVHRSQPVATLPIHDHLTDCIHNAAIFPIEEQIFSCFVTKNESSHDYLISLITQEPGPKTKI